MTNTLQDRARRAHDDLHAATAPSESELWPPDHRRAGVLIAAVVLVVVVATVGMAAIVRHRGHPVPPTSGISGGRIVTIGAAGLALTVPRDWTDSTSPPEPATVASLAAPGGGLIVQAVAVGAARADSLARQIAANVTNADGKPTVVPDRTVGIQGDRVDWDFEGHVTAYVFVTNRLGIALYFHNIAPTTTADVLASYRPAPPVDTGMTTIHAQGLTMQVPAQWTSRGPSEPTPFGTFRTAMFTTAGVTGALWIGPHEDQAPAQAAATLQAQLRQLGARNIATTERSIGATRALQIDYKSDTQLGRPVGFPLTYRTYVLETKNGTVGLTMVGPDSSDTRALFDRIAATLTLD